MASSGPKSKSGSDNGDPGGAAFSDEIFNLELLAEAEQLRPEESSIGFDPEKIVSIGDG